MIYVKIIFTCVHVVPALAGSSSVLSIGGVSATSLRLVSDVVELGDTSLEV